jgi:hypothetical protein
MLSSNSLAEALRSDGNKLLRECEDALKAVGTTTTTAREFGQGLYCIGFVHGLVDMNTVYDADGAATFFCPPQEFTVGQGVRVVVKFLQDHPERLHKDEAILAVSALQQAFPCLSKRK